MSAIQQMLFAGRAPVTVSSTVYGSGSLSIPAGVTSVSLTGQGGSGTYSPGQGSASYPSGLPPYNAGQAFSPSTVSGSGTLTANFQYWTNGDPQYVSFTYSGTADGENTYAITISGYPPYIGSSINPSNYVNGGSMTGYYAVASPFIMINYMGGGRYQGSQSSYTIVPETPYIAPTGNASYPSGLPTYVAPSYTTGPSTTATLNGVTNTWAGGYGGAGSPSSQPLSSTGAGQTLTYNVGSGGYLTYSYTY